MSVLRFFPFSGIALGVGARGGRGAMETCWDCRVSRIRDWGWPLLGVLSCWTLSQAEMVRNEDRGICVRLGLM